MNNEISATANAKRYYQSCLDEGTIEVNGEKALLDVINKDLGGWPLLDNSYDPDKITLSQKLIRMRKLEIQPLFLFYIDANPKDPKKKVLRVNRHFF